MANFINWSYNTTLSSIERTDPINDKYERIYLLPKCNKKDKSKVTYDKHCNITPSDTLLTVECEITTSTK